MIVLTLLSLFSEIKHSYSYSYLIGNGVVRPDPERLRPLQELPPPTNVRSHRRALGLFAHYAKWIPNFSEKIQPLSKALTYPLCKKAIDSFNTLKGDMESAAVD